jgi:hypothetical protein
LTAAKARPAPATNRKSSAIVGLPLRSSSAAKATVMVIV